jgi:hypothetical protein
MFGFTFIVSVKIRGPQNLLSVVIHSNHAQYFIEICPVVPQTKCMILSILCAIRSHDNMNNGVYFFGHLVDAIPQTLVTVEMYPNNNTCRAPEERYIAKCLPSAERVRTTEALL